VDALFVAQAEAVGAVPEEPPPPAVHLGGAPSATLLPPQDASVLVLDVLVAATLTVRGTHPHVRVDVLAVDDFAVAASLPLAPQVLVAAVALGVAVFGAVLPTGSFGVEVHLVLDVALQQLGHFHVRVAGNVPLRVTLPQVLRRRLHRDFHRLDDPVGALLEAFPCDFRLGSEVAFNTTKR
jgi:hypothetical protein